MNFPTTYAEIIQSLDEFDPLPYAKTRNFGDGQVSRLSPYISRGVISTRQVFEGLKAKKYSFHQIEKFIQELAWRDYWQLIWMAKGDEINEDLKQTQTQVLHHEMPTNLENGQTDIQVVDSAIEHLKETGYMHNHMRMYIAAIACKNGKSHWKVPALWMYYHLLDADWASNALSWQWVAGANSNKKYIANQDNINTYFHSNQQHTFLDKSYEEITKMDCPDVLKKSSKPKLLTELPTSQDLKIDPSLPTFIYNEYNLDPMWRKETKGNRILLLDPKKFGELPMSPLTIEFLLKLSHNIPSLQIFTASFSKLQKAYQINDIYYKEHPLNKDYQGTMDSRDWLSSIKGYYPSFFAFWKKCKKEINY